MRQTATKHEIRECYFSILVTEGTAAIKFSCVFFLQLKTVNSRHVISSPRRCRLVEGKLGFNEELSLVTNMLYDARNRKYVKKEVLVIMNLVSNSRPSESKMVGRVVVDLGGAANGLQYQQIGVYPLEYCSVGGTLAFSVVLKEAIPTNLMIRDLELSQLSEFESILLNNSTKTQDLYRKRKESATVVEMERVIRNKGVPESHQISFDKKLSRNRTEIGLLKGDISQRKTSVKYQVDDTFLRERNEQRANMESTVARKNGPTKGNEKDYILIRDNHEIDSKKCGSDETVKGLCEDRVTSIMSEYKARQEMRMVPLQLSSSSKDEGCSIELQNDNGSSSLQREERQIATKRVKILLEENREQQIRLEKSERELMEKSKQIQRLNVIVNEKGKGMNREIGLSYSEMVVFKKQLLQRQRDIQQYQHKIEELSLAIVAKDSEIASVSKLLLEKQVIIKEQVGKVEQLNRTLSQSNSRMGELEREVLQREREIDEYVQRIEKLQRCELQLLQVGEIREQKRSLLQQNEFIKKELSEKVARIFEMQQVANEKRSMQAIEREQQITKIKTELDSTLQQLQNEMKNHEMTNVQLKEVREWYNKMQEEMSKLQTQNMRLKQELKEERTKQKDYQCIIVKLQQKIAVQDRFQEKYRQKQGQMISLQSQLDLRRSQIASYAQKIGQQTKVEQQYRQKGIQLQAQLAIRKEELALYIQREANDTSSQKRVLLQKALEKLQQRFQNQYEELQMSRERIQELQEQIREGQIREVDYTVRIRKGLEEKESLELKNEDMEKRLREREEEVGRLRKSLEQYRGRVKRLQEEKSEDAKQFRTLQRENRQFRSRLEKDEQSWSRQISRLGQVVSVLQTEKDQLIKELNRVRQRQAGQVQNMMNGLQRMVKQKELKRKVLLENLQVLEYESDRMAEVLQSKETYQLQLTEVATTLYTQNAALRKSLGEMQSKCRMNEQKSQELASKVQLLTFHPVPREREMMLSTRRVMQANQEMLRAVGEKSREIMDRIKVESELRNLLQQCELSRDLCCRQKEQMQEALQKVNHINSRLEKELERARLRCQSEREAAQERIDCLSNEISELQRKMDANEKIRELQTRIEELTLQIATLTQAKETRETFAQQSCDSECLRREQGMLSIRILQGEIVELSEKCERQQKELARLRQMNSGLQETSEEEMSHIEYLQLQVRSFRERENEYISRIEELVEGREREKTARGQQRIFHSVLGDSLEMVELKRRYQLEKAQSQELLRRVKAELESAKRQLSELRSKIQQNHTKTLEKHKNCIGFNYCSGESLKYVVDELNQVVSERRRQEELQTAFRVLIESSARQDEQYEKWIRDRGFIQERAKGVSRQLQRVKASVLKMGERSMAQRTQLVGLLRPTQVLVNELINVSQKLAEADLLQEQEEGSTQYTRNRP